MMSRRDLSTEDRTSLPPDRLGSDRLGGERPGAERVTGGRIELPSFGRGRSDLRAADISRALDFYAVVLNVALGFCAVIAVLVGR